MVIRKKKNEDLTNDSSQLIVVDNPFSRASDEFRILRTNIQYSFQEKELKTLAITSPKTGDGKTTLASNLAASFAQERTMVLLVDTNLRNPGIHKLLGIENEIGLADLLTDKKLNFGEVIKKSQLNNLHFMTAGRKTLNPTELLNSERMEELINRMKNRYDLIVFDTPSILSTADAQLIAAKVNCTLLAYSTEETSAEELEESINSLKNVHANILGTIGNKF